MSAASTAKFTPRHVALGRAAAAAIAAVMVTFTSDHSALLGLSVFSGFAVMTALVWALAAWLVVPAGARTTPIALALISGAAGIVSGASGVASLVLLTVVMAGWALLTGALELIQGVRRRPVDAATARDEITVGALTLLLGVVTIAVAFVPTWDYFAREADSYFTFTSSIIMVGVFGGYAAILAVYLGIAGLSPAKAEQQTALAHDDAPASGKGLS